MKAVISLSGGLDSTCLLMHLLASGYDEIRAYSFDYGQKHSIELEKVKNNIAFLQEKGFNVEHQIINVRDVFSDSASTLHENGGEIPKGHYQDSTMKSTVVENRNVIFSAIIYGKALSWANKTGDNVVITLGIHAGDHAIYPDCTPESHNIAKYLFKISNWNSDKVDYIAPFENIDKGAVLGAGLAAMKRLKIKKADMRTVLANTHTCYSPDEEGRSCGECGSCRERLEAFEKNNMEDPIEYAPKRLTEQMMDSVIEEALAEMKKPKNKPRKTKKSTAN